jgi:hypothetical protein
MAAQILPFPKPVASAATPLACFVRVGEAHKKVADLHAAGHLPARQVVIEASRYRHQRELVSAFRESGAEIVLDTEAAELAAPAKFRGHSHRAPWALPDGPLGPDRFRNRAPDDVVGKIARFAVANNVDVVLAPSHFLGDPACTEWLLIDAAACRALRSALDREGGSHIAIDYQVIISNAALSDVSIRGAVLSTLADLPIDNVWVRASGFGSDAGPLTMKRYLSAISGFHNLGKPIIGDYLGGIAGMTALAFGVLSGLGPGIGERERFDAGTWHKPPEPRSEDAEFGRAVRVSIPVIQRSVTLKELGLLVSAKGGTRLCGCGDRSCCPHGYKDMIADPRRHAAQQLFKSLLSLEAVPDLRRETHFLDGPMANMDRLARQIKALRPAPTEAEKLGVDGGSLMKRLEQHSRRVEKLRVMLEHMHVARGDEGPRAAPMRRRELPEAKASRDQP